MNNWAQFTSTVEVQLREVGGPCESIEGNVGERQSLVILHSYVVEPLISRRRDGTCRPS